MGRISKTTTLQLEREERMALVEEIHQYFLEEREEDLGIIAGENILEFFLETLGSKIYNKALDDAMKWHKRMSDNLESDFYALYKEER